MKTVKSLTLTLLTLAYLFSTSTANAQHDFREHSPVLMIPPIPVELFATDERISYLMIVNKPIANSEKLTFFNVTSFKANYENIEHENEYIAQGLIQYEFIKGLSVATGLTQHYRTGFRPTLGLNYLFANRKILGVLLPRFDLTEDYNFEVFGLFEFKPKISENLSLYSRVQGLYNWNTEGEFHDRSYVYLRLGLSYRSYQFGLGADFDTYGPKKFSTDGFGVFIRTQLFN